MKSRPFEMCLLFDFYGDILTDKQKDMFDLYYNNDLSLSEISEEVGITRQGVRDSIMRAETILRDTEDRLKLVARYGNLKSDIDEIAEAAQYIFTINESKYRNSDIANQASFILSKAADLSK